MGTRDWDDWLDWGQDEEWDLETDEAYAEYMRLQDEAEAERREETPIFHALCEWHQWTPVPE